MDSNELRGSLELLLDFVTVLTSGDQVSPQELETIEGATEKIRASLVPKGSEEPKGFPRGHWVFRVSRKQFLHFSVEAKDRDAAYHRAESRVHGDIEGMRFTWDRSDPYSLDAVELVRGPQ